MVAILPCCVEVNCENATDISPRNQNYTTDVFGLAVIQKSLLQKVNGAKFFAVTNNTNTWYAEILQFADWSKFKQCGQDFFMHRPTLPRIARTLPCSLREWERRHETTATMSDDMLTNNNWH